MQFSPFTRHIIPLRSKYPPLHPVLKHSHFRASKEVGLIINVEKTKYSGTVIGNMQYNFFCIFLFPFSVQDPWTHTTKYNNTWTENACCIQPLNAECVP
jgi:hypothetical protein